MSELAIVIPAYKPEFLAEALVSIRQQTDRRFRLYVGDDGGPPEIREICRRFAGLDMTYHRFDENLGRTSLTGHWNRCVRLSGEEWVWLFADDDEMAPDCVQAFHDERPHLHGVDLVRFQTDTIDASGRVLAHNAPHPRSEKGEAFIRARLSGERDSFVVEYVFRRAAFERIGGFLDFPMGWCADDATWFRLSRPAGIRTLRAGRVRWRASGLNITGANRRHGPQKLTAALQYLDFVDREVRRRPLASTTPSAQDDRGAPGSAGAGWERAELEWLLGQLRYLMPMGPSMLARATRLTRDRWPLATAKKWALLLAWNLAAVGRTLRGVVRRRLGGVVRRRLRGT